MTLLDRFLDRLEDACRQEVTQKRLQASLLDPAAAYLARKLFKFTAVLGALLLLQLAILTALAARAFNFSLPLRA